MSTVASPQDVETALGRSLATDEVTQVQWWLAGIELRIVSRLGAIDGLPNTAAVKYVEAEAVAAKVRRHGTQESSVTVSVDDASVTRRYENGVTDADIADDLWRLITPANALGAFTMRTGQPREFQVRYARQGWCWHR